jgi:hypothetical protein
MEKILLIAGCSHAAGSEINGQEDSVYNRQHAFGALVAEHFGYKSVNIAQNGMSNSGIARSILKWFQKNYDPTRMKEGGDPEEKSIVPYYHKFMAQNETFLELQSVQLVLQIQYFLKSLNVNYLMCNSLYMFNKKVKQVEEFIALVDNTKYYKLDNNDASFFIKYKNLGYVNELAKYWHHGEVPHACYADELIKHIEEQKWEL